jgi:hypothetical protein
MGGQTYPQIVGQNPWGHTWDGSWTQMAPRSAKISATPSTCRLGCPARFQSASSLAIHASWKDGELSILTFWRHQSMININLLIWISTIVVFKKDMMFFQDGPNNAWTSWTSHPDCRWADGVGHHTRLTGIFSHVCIVKDLWNALYQNQSQQPHICYKKHYTYRNMSRMCPHTHAYIHIV